MFAIRGCNSDWPNFLYVFNSRIAESTSILVTQYLKSKPQLWNYLINKLVSVVWPPKLIKHGESWDSQLSNGHRVWRLRESWPFCHIKKRVIFSTDFGLRFFYLHRPSQILESLTDFCFDFFLHRFSQIEYLHRCGIFYTGVDVSVTQASNVYHWSRRLNRVVLLRAMQ